MRSIAFAAAAMLLFCLSTKPVTGQALKIGDTIPETGLLNVLNTRDSKLSLSSFRGKLLILDFWGHTCPSCISAFPKMDSLQTMFDDRIQIIGVNKESKDSTERLFKRFKKIHRPSFPLICGDTVLTNLFPANYLPWHAWVDEHGVVTFITDGWNATIKNISSFLKGKRPELSSKQIVKDYDYKRGYLTQSSDRFAEAIAYSSFIGKVVPNLMLGNHDLRKTEDGKFVQLFQYSSSIADLIILAFNEGGKYNFYQQSNVVLDIPTKDNYLYPSDPSNINEWERKHAYTYELKLPVSFSSRAYQFMQQDLMRYFNLSVKRERRVISCLALTLLDKKEKPLNNPDTTLFSQLNTYDRFMYLNDEPISTLLKILKYPLLPYKTFDQEFPPIIDRTNYRGNISIKIAADIIATRNPKAFKKELNKYNLDLVEIKCPVTVLVIKER